MSSENIASQPHDTNDWHSEREPCSWAKYLVFLPNFVYVLSGNNQSREVTGYIWHFLISTETSVKSNFLEIHWVHDLTWDIIQFYANLCWQHSNSCKSLAIIVESQAKIFLCINMWLVPLQAFEPPPLVRKCMLHTTKTAHDSPHLNPKNDTSCQRKL